MGLSGMPHKLSVHVAHMLGEFLACYLVTLKVIEELLPFIKQHGYRAYKRKLKRRKAKQKGRKQS